MSEGISDTLISQPKISRLSRRRTTNAINEGREPYINGRPSHL